jgi:hypothetical protein
MKNILFIFFLLYLSIGTAQKHDYHWLSGYQGDTPNAEVNEFGMTQTSFDGEKPTVKYVQSDLYFSQCGLTFSDATGNLIFYSNGIKLYNQLHKPMKNSENLSVSKFNSTKTNGIYTRQGIMALPVPNSSTSYYLSSLFKINWVKKGQT